MPIIRKSGCRVQIIFAKGANQTGRREIIYNLCSYNQLSVLLIGLMDDLEALEGQNRVDRLDRF